MMSPSYSPSLASHRSPIRKMNRNSTTSDSDLLDMNGKVTLKRDKKARDIWLITTTDREGFHRQLPITFDDMRELVRLWIEETI